MSAKEARNSKPSIFEFHDYREFITAWFDHNAELGTGLSMRKVAKQAGFSHNFFSNFLKGNRPLRKAAAKKFIPFMALDAKEEEFFLLLIDMAEAKDSEKQQDALAKIKKMRRFANSNPGDFEALELLSNWHYIAIRELATQKDFQLDEKWIQTRLRHYVPIADIRKALNFMIHAGFIGVDVKNRAYVPQKKITCRDGMYRLALSGFHKIMLDQAKLSIDEDSRENRHQVSCTLSLDTSRYKKACEIVENAKKQLLELDAESKREGEEVYYVNFSTFPLTKGKS